MIQIRYILIILSAMVLVSCEDTNIAVMTDAASDAVTAITLSDESVKNIAQRAAYDADGKHHVAPTGNPYDARLRKLVADQSKRDGNSFNFKAYLTKDVNAFAMADGTIRVFSGLMDLMNDEELLFVIGHEMGHVVKNHSRKKVVLAYSTSALRKGLASQESQIGQIASSVIGSFAEQLTHAQFSQHEERQADQYAADFLQAEGYQIASAVSALNKLAALARQHTFLSSHPDPEARAKRLLQKENTEGEDQISILEKVLQYGQRIVIGLFELILVLIRWVVSLL
ncbi:MAG: M48 family metallopeptidase [Desulforhopalus sp.]|nr:M48 family metallopeptidase [Desulforhopalus sp.]